MKMSPYSTMRTYISVPFAAYATNVVTTGGAVDLLWWRSAVVQVLTGTITDGTYTVEVQHSDASGSGFTAVDTSELQGPEPAIVAANDNAVFEIGYLGSKRYLKVVVTATGTTSGGVLGACVLVGSPRRAPITRP